MSIENYIDMVDALCNKCQHWQYCSDDEKSCKTCEMNGGDYCKCVVDRGDNPDECQHFKPIVQVKKSPTNKLFNKYKLHIIFTGVLLVMFVTGLIIGRVSVKSSAMTYEQPPIVTTTSTYDTSSVIESEPITESIESEEWVDFVATAYCPCEKCCGVWATKRELDDNGNPIVYGATGIILKQGVSVAADKTYPMGTSLEIEGMGTYIVHDRGGAIKGNRLDIYFDNHTDALEFGVQTVNVRVTK